MPPYAHAVADALEFIAGMPKAELHLHIEGTLEPELKFELAARNGSQLPYANVDEMRAAYDFDDLASFLAVYYEGMSVLLTEQDFYDLATAYFRKARAQNVVYAEIFFDPQAHTSRGVPFETVDRRAPPRAARRRRRARRPQPADHVLPARHVGGVGDGDARAGAAVRRLDRRRRARLRRARQPAREVRRGLRAARGDEGFRLTMHCDVDQEDSVAHIWQCLDEIEVERVDHGVNALEDPG